MFQDLEFAHLANPAGILITQFSASQGGIPGNSDGGTSERTVLRTWNYNGSAFRRAFDDTRVVDPSHDAAGNAPTWASSLVIIFAFLNSYLDHMIPQEGSVSRPIGQTPRAQAG